MSDVPPLTDDDDSESGSENNSIDIKIPPVMGSIEIDTNKNSSNNSIKDDVIGHPEEARTGKSGSVSRQNSNTSSEGSAEYREDDEREFNRDCCKGGRANQLSHETSMQSSELIHQNISHMAPVAQANKLLFSVEDKLQTCLQQASLAYCNKNYLSSASEYKIALMLIAEKKKKYKFVETWIIKYCLGLSLINLTPVKEIHDGEKVFQSLINDEKPGISILGYLGLAKAYLKQNRFVDAVSPLQEGLNLICEGFCPPTSSNWPGTLIAIEETIDTPGLLKDLFETLLGGCRNPPLPLAICRYSSCCDPFKPQIYLTDPEFKGFTQVACFEKCLMEFHRDCWRELKAEQFDKRSDKELVNGPCLTPDCNSTVCRISVFGADGNILKTVTCDEVSSKSKKAGQKNKAVSVQHGKAMCSKKVSGKRTKGGILDEKTRTEECPMLSDNKIRSGENYHGRDDLKPVEMKMADAGRVAKLANRRKSLESNSFDDNEHIQMSKKKGSDPAVTDVDPLVTMQRTDFVALQRKRNEEQFFDSLFKRPKKKREKDPKKKVLHLDEFVEKTETDDGEPADDHYLEANPYCNLFWEIPPTATVNSQEQDWIRPSSNEVSFPNRSADGNSVRNENIWSVSDMDVASEKAAGDATISKNMVERLLDDLESVPVAKNSPEPSVPHEKPLEAEDVKGNIMSYFEVLLEKLGPCLPDDEPIQRELEAFPIEAQIMISDVGGIAKLLLQSLKFSQVDGYICLLKDAARARQKARQRRLELIEGKNFVKRFGLLSGKPNPPVATKENSVSAVSTSAVSVPAACSAAVDSKPSVTVTNTVTVTSSSSAVLTGDRKGDDRMFGLCDLNEYRENLRSKNSSSPLINQSENMTDHTDSPSVEDDSGLSVIERFKKEVHKAASKEKKALKDKVKALSSLVPPVSMPCTVSVSGAVNTYGKSSIIGSDRSVGVVGNATNNSSADVFSYRDGKAEKGSEMLDISRSSSEMLYNLLDIVDDDDKGRKSVLDKGIIDVRDFDLPLTANSASPKSDGVSENSSWIRSTLSVTASEFHFPKFTSGMKSPSVLTQSSAVPPATCVTTGGGLGGTYASYSPHLSSYSYSMNGNPVVTSYNGHSPGMCRLQMVKSPIVVTGMNLGSYGADSGNSNSYGVCGGDPDSFGAVSGYGCENKASNTDEREFNSDDYDYLKRKCDNLLERQQMMKNCHAEELENLREKLEIAEKKSHSLEKELLQWRSEKKKYEEEIEKLRSDLALTKTSLQSANHLVDVTDRLLTETQNALQTEQQQCLSLRAKYENLLCQLERNLSTNKFEANSVAPVSVPVPVDDVSSNAGKKTKNSFHKILSALSTMFPNLTKNDLSRYIQEVRMRRNNSLSGLTVHEIVACVRELVLREHAEKQMKKNVLDLPYNLPYMGKHNNGTNGSTHGEEVFNEEIDPCIICHEELNKDSASLLDCGHSFHTECVRKWFREQSTCPTCRNHALLPDEFPALGTHK